MKFIIASILTIASAHGATLIYEHNFLGIGSAPLDGAEVETSSGTLGGTAGATWTAGTLWEADGTTTKTASSQHSAYVPFSPQDGYIYRISATVSIDSIGTGDYWVAMSLLDGAPETSTAFHNLNTTYATIGRRASGYGGNNLLRWPGPKTSGGAHLNNTTPDAWRLSIVLDTTVSGSWSYRLMMEGGTDTEVISNSYSLPSNSIDYIMFSNFQDVSASVDNFVVTAEIPEPTLPAMASLLLAAMLPLRRSR